VTPNPQDFAMAAWKQPLEIAFRMVEALTQGATRLHEVQLDASTEAHADAVATLKAIQEASDPARVLELQILWTRANAEKAAAYWRAIFATMMQTQGELARCALPRAPLQAASRAADAAKAADASAEASTEAVLAMMDSAYRQWLAASQQLYSGRKEAR